MELKDISRKLHAIFASISLEKKKNSPQGHNFLQVGLGNVEFIFLGYMFRNTLNTLLLRYKRWLVIQ